MGIRAFKLGYHHALRNTHAFAIIDPWLDVGNVGTLTLNSLMKYLDAREVGRLKDPQMFFDFTRYRPIVYYQQGERKIAIPDSFVYATQQEPHFVFLQLREPHLRAEEYSESLLGLLEELDVKRYSVIGSMCDINQPHTRPLRITGMSSTKKLKGVLSGLNILQSKYEGPTTPLACVSLEAEAKGIETMFMIVHIPHYFIGIDTCTADYHQGQYSLLEKISTLYQLPIDLSEIKLKADKMHQDIDAEIRKDTRLREIVGEVERLYDTIEENEKTRQTQGLISRLNQRKN